jgi:hypothetical protein
VMKRGRRGLITNSGGLRRMRPESMPEEAVSG